MPKKVVKVVKVMAMGGNASPAPPLGPALGQAGVDIGGFVKKFNDATKDQKGQRLPVVITVYEDRSFTFKVKSPPASELIKQALNLEKGSGEPNKKKVGTINRRQLEEIAKTKMEDLNARDVDAAVRIIAGTAKSMGVMVEGV
jgi:large subunit ribosomal protein L11